MKREYLDYIEDAVGAMSDVQSFVKDMEYEAFCGDRKTVLAVIAALEIVGEAVKGVPSSVRKQYPEIPWRAVSGMRDKLIHEYFGVTLKVVWDTVRNDVPVLKPLFEKILEDHGGKQGMFR